MKRMIIFIGIQASGKSYYYENVLKSEYKHINLDELHTRNKELQLLTEYLDSLEDIVIDNTNPTKADRVRYVLLAKEHGYHISGYFFESKIKDCIDRNEQRTGKAKVPRQAIAATSNKLEMPSYEEGFDELYFIGRDGEGNMVKSEWRDEP